MNEFETEEPDVQRKPEDVWEKIQGSPVLSFSGAGQSPEQV